MARGKKTCPECQAEVGPRTAECECGYVFPFAKGKAPKGRKPKPPQVEKPFEALTEDPSEVIGVTDREALDSFIDQLQTCRDESRNTGGVYSAFLHHRTGTLRVEVGLRWVVK